MPSLKSFFSPHHDEDYYKNCSAKVGETCSAQKPADSKTFTGEYRDTIGCPLVERVQDQVAGSSTLHTKQHFGKLDFQYGIVVQSSVNSYAAGGINHLARRAQESKIAYHCDFGGRDGHHGQNGHRGQNGYIGSRGTSGVHGGGRGGRGGNGSNGSRGANGTNASPSYPSADGTITLSAGRHSSTVEMKIQFSRTQQGGQIHNSSEPNYILPSHDNQSEVSKGDGVRKIDIGSVTVQNDSVCSSCILVDAKGGDGGRGGSGGDGGHGGSVLYIYIPKYTILELYYFIV